MTPRSLRAIIFAVLPLGTQFLAAGTEIEADSASQPTEWSTATYDQAAFSPKSAVWDLVIAGHVHMSQLLWFTPESQRHSSSPAMEAPSSMTRNWLSRWNEFGRQGPRSGMTLARIRFHDNPAGRYGIRNWGSPARRALPGYLPICWSATRLPPRLTRATLAARERRAL